MDFAKVEGMPSSIVNAYESNDPHDRCMLWRRCVLSLSPTMWIMCGEFNIVEKVSNKIRRNPNRWATGEERRGTL